MKTKKEIKNRLDELKEDWMRVSRRYNPNKKNIINKKIEMLEWVLK